MLAALFICFYLVESEKALNSNDQTNGTSISYRDAGVDIEAGDALVEQIKPFAKRTMRPEVLAGIGGFGSLFEMPKKFKNPVLVSGTDGVGTKLKLAFELNKHDTVGIDLVAMSVNDILVESTNHTKALLKQELSIRLEELNEKWHASSLEKILISLTRRRIYSMPFLFTSFG